MMMWWQCYMFLLPWPKGPVVTSMPCVWVRSGWPGVLFNISLVCLFTKGCTYMLPTLRNALRSSMDTLKPIKCKRIYCKTQAWPFERTKRSRFGQCGFFGLTRTKFVKSTCAMGANPIGAPGCPELAPRTTSAAKVRIVLIQRSSIDIGKVEKPWFIDVLGYPMLYICVLNHGFTNARIPSWKFP